MDQTVLNLGPFAFLEVSDHTIENTFPFPLSEKEVGRSDHRPIIPTYYIIEDCRIFVFFFNLVSKINSVVPYAIFLVMNISRG